MSSMSLVLSLSPHPLCTGTFQRPRLGMHLPPPATPCFTKLTIIFLLRPLSRRCTWTELSWTIHPVRVHFHVHFPKNSKIQNLSELYTYLTRRFDFQGYCIGKHDRHGISLPLEHDRRGFWHLFPTSKFRPKWVSGHLGFFSLLGSNMNWTRFTRPSWVRGEKQPNSPVLRCGSWWRKRLCCTHVFLWVQPTTDNAFTCFYYINNTATRILSELFLWVFVFVLWDSDRRWLMTYQVSHVVQFS